MSAEGASRQGGSGSMLPEKIMKFWCSETLFLCSAISSKIFVKLSVIFIPIFICVFSHTSTRFCFIFQTVYLRFRGISFTLLGVLVYFSKQMSKLGFFLCWSHIGRDSRFSSKIGRIPTRSGWLDILNWWLKFKRTKTTREVKVALPFSCLMFKFSFTCNCYNLYVILRLKFERTKLAFFKISTPLSFASSVPFTITETEIETRDVFRSN